MVGPQDTYNAGPNVNGVIGPNSGTNILTTSHMFLHLLDLKQQSSENQNLSRTKVLAWILVEMKRDETS